MCKMFFFIIPNVFFLNSVYIHIMSQVSCELFIKFVRKHIMIDMIWLGVPDTPKA